MVAGAQGVAIKDGVKPGHIVDRPAVVTRMKSGIQTRCAHVVRLRDGGRAHGKIVGEGHGMYGVGVGPTVSRELLPHLEGFAPRVYMDPARRQGRDLLLYRSPARGRIGS